ncbi:hypothetical protein [Sphingobium sp. YR768]|uniref:hypothetical protein n=1 Tax=Sphingobium sp. YR768 TaxID=1884365 RepID=UPI0008D714F5|nr:hypothetical protein [Sphingobium sp. YR768]SER38287.1 hypothetical protein SAMN05518866_11012 [Sphingobium sp. YR768]
MPDVPPTRKLTIIAKDPGLRIGGASGPMAMVQVSVPAEKLTWGPTGYRVKVVDYNSSERKLYKAQKHYQDSKGALVDPFAPQRGETLLDKTYQTRLIADPNFHSQNVYAIAMRTLGIFERALGRRVAWSFGGHQLHIAPHAFEQANAFYSEPDWALMFGYIRDAKGQPVFACLSHDIVAHETTHALLDGLRTRFTDPSGPDQGAFHEGFADIVALLSVFSLEPVVAAAIGEDGEFWRDGTRIALVSASKFTLDRIKKSILLGMAKQFGAAMEDGKRDALRRSVTMKVEEAQTLREGSDEHDRGEVIVAAMMNAFVEMWLDRIRQLGKFESRYYNLMAVVEEGAKVAGHLINMAIRALDYCPPVDIDFSQYLAALLTADRELVPDDEHGYRKRIRDVFGRYGISLPAKGCDNEGCWSPCAYGRELEYARSNFGELTRSKDEMFRFIWENRDRLGVNSRAYAEVLTIEPAVRAGPDGILLHETICQYYQRVDIFGAEFESLLGAERPEGLSSRDRYTAFGGGVLVFDQYGQVKYHIANPIDDPERQQARARYLIDTGQVGQSGSPSRMRFALDHLERMERGVPQ